MGLFHKKEKVPEIAPSSNLPTLMEPPKEKTSELPSLPKGLNEQANRAMVKSAVNDLDSPTDRGVVEELPRDFKFEESVLTPNEAMIPSIPSIPKEEPKKIEIKPFQSTPPTNQQNSTEPIFVRIDKFQTAKKDLAEINKSIKSVEGLLGKLSEIKSREDSEVAKISESLSSIKTRLTSIDSNVFKKA